MTMTRQEAVEWVRTRDDQEQLDENDLREAFHALYGRWPDAQDEEEGVFSHVCAAAQEGRARKRIWTANREWLTIAVRDGLTIDWEAEPVSGDEWTEACAAAGLDPQDYEVGFAVLTTPRECDTLLRSGDIVATSGPGSDAVFLR